MVINKTGYVGYTAETTFSIRAPTTPSTGTQAYKFGLHDPELPPIPTLQHKVVQRQTHSSFSPSSLEPGMIEIESEMDFHVINGVELYYAMGSISTTGTGPYTHTITGMTPGSTKPSRTFHFEELDGTVPVYRDYPGCLTRKLELSQSEKGPLIANLDYTAQRLITNSAVTLAAVVHDTKPVVPTLSGTKGYFMDNNGAISENGQTLVDPIKVWNLIITNTWEPLLGTTRTTTDEYNKSSKRWIEDWFLVEQNYSLIMTLDRGSTGTYIAEEAILNEDFDNDWLLKLVRGTNDSIQFNLDADKTIATNISAMLAQVYNPAKFATYRLTTKSLSCTVIDAMANASYKL